VVVGPLVVVVVLGDSVVVVVVLIHALAQASRLLCR
jgi:hypothetical protein